MAPAAKNGKHATQGNVVKNGIAQGRKMEIHCRERSKCNR
jgi:hypothetical protein